MNRDIEVLSPAGYYDSFLAALNAGADAVYLGGTSFGARAFSNNFTQDELLKAIDKAHIHNKKVYLTVNTLLKDNELQQHLYDFLKPYYENGLDAIIVQDMGVLRFVKQYFPQLPIHASTQMTITGVSGAKLLQEMGVSRIVTSRELNLDEIKRIHEEVDVEIESFVHGALCYCYSGQCLMSSLIGGRSGNRGRCAQPCRLQYDVKNQDNRTLNDKNEKYIISPKDMCALPILPQILEAGASSLKIEGRMKSSEYTAGVVSIYRKYVDKYLEFGPEQYHVSNDDMNRLKDLFNRGGFTKGYYVEDVGKNMLSLSRPNHQGVKALEVLDNNRGSLKCKAIETIYPGDVFEINKELNYTIKNQVEVGDNITLNIPHKYDVRKGEFFYRIRNNNLIDEINDKYINAQKKENLEGSIELHLGKPAVMKASLLDRFGNERTSVTVEEDIVEPAVKQPMDSDKIRKQMCKTGATSYTFQQFTVDMDHDIFVPVQKLNDLRRNIIEKLEKKTIESYKRVNIIEYKNSSKSDQTIKKSNITNIKINVSLEHIQLLDTVLAYTEVDSIYLEISQFQDDIELKEAVDKCKNANKDIFFIMPVIFRDQTKKYIDKSIEFLIHLNPTGFVVKNLEEVQYFKELANNNAAYFISIVLDSNVYTFNQMAREQYQSIATNTNNFRILYDTAPIELNEKELKILSINHSELIVYGFIPVMVTAQCIHKTTGKCDKQSGDSLYLNDRKNKDFLVKNNCKFCYNTIYNTSPIYIIDKTQEIFSLNPFSIRVILTWEDIETAKKVLDDTIEAFIRKNKVINSLDDFTRGHFLRGVE